MKPIADSLPGHIRVDKRSGGGHVESDKGPTDESSLASAAKPPLPMDKADAATDSGRLVVGQPIDETPNRSDEAATATEKDTSISGGKRRHAQPRYEVYHRFDDYWGWRDTRDPSIEGVLAGSKAIAEGLLYEMNEAHESEHLPPREEVGELAQLKSGGPVMTIVGASQPGKVLCTWFRGDLAKLKYFPTKSLRIPQPKKGLRPNFSKQAKKKHKQKRRRK